MVPFEQTAPGAVPELSSSLSRTDDVGDEDCCEYTVPLERVPHCGAPQVNRMTDHAVTPRSKIPDHGCTDSLE
jgi:hypothetical protein